jgi:multiple sugar transport system substrate-binding protein
VLDSDAYKKSAGYAPSFVESMGMVKDFWAEPLYVPLLLDMQNRVHDYVVANKGTSQQALDSLVKDWIKVFKQEGKNPS